MPTPTLRWTRRDVRAPKFSPLRKLAASFVSATSPETIPIELPVLSDWPSPLQKAELLLHTAAEVEHVLLVQYLYAAYSLKNPADVTDPQQKELLTRWKPVIRGIAKEEMGHLMTVQNLLLLLGLPLNLEREDFPPRKDLYPFAMHLEPLTHASLAKYVVAESPVDAMGIEDIVKEATGNVGMPINRVGVLYGLLGVIFTRSGDIDPATASSDPWQHLLTDLAYLAYQGQSSAAWHLPDSVLRPASVSQQGRDDEWGPGSSIRVHVVTNRADALAALADIAVQGEGPAPGQDPTGSHFERFLRILRGDGTVPGFPLPGDWQPAWPVPTDPRLALAAESAGPNEVTHPRARAWAQLADLRYALLLGFIEHHLSITSPDDRAKLRLWALGEMGLLRRLSEKLIQMPRSAAATGVAALPFTLPTLLHLPSEDEARWRLHQARLRDAISLIEHLRQAGDPEDAFLGNLLDADRTEKLAYVDSKLGGPLAPAVNLARVRQILEAAAGAGDPFHDGFHRFWNLPRNTLLALSVYGQKVIETTGDDRGARSALVKALRGQPPFDGSQFERMPLAMPPVPDNEIAEIVTWIDAGCPE